MARGVPGLIDPKTGEPRSKQAKTARESYNKQMSDARVKRLELQNQKLELETEKLRESLVPVDEVKRLVLAANSLVKTRLMALPEKLAPLCQHRTPAVIATLIRDAIIETMNELTYERLAEEQEAFNENEEIEPDTSIPEVINGSNEVVHEENASEEDY